MRTAPRVREHRPPGPSVQRKPNPQGTQSSLLPLPPTGPPATLAQPRVPSSPAGDSVPLWSQWAPCGCFRVQGGVTPAPSPAGSSWGHGCAAAPPKHQGETHLTHSQARPRGSLGWHTPRARGQVTAWAASGQPRPGLVLLWEQRLAGLYSTPTACLQPPPGDPGAAESRAPAPLPAGSPTLAGPGTQEPSRCL